MKYEARSLFESATIHHNWGGRIQGQFCDNKFTSLEMCGIENYKLVFLPIELLEISQIKDQLTDSGHLDFWRCTHKL